MELQSFDDNQFESSFKKLDNKEKENSKNDIPERKNNKKNSSYYLNKKFIFIALFFLYLLFIYLFCEIIYQKKHKSQSYENNTNSKINSKIKEEREENGTDLSSYISSFNLIEELLQELTPSDSYRGPIFPNNGKITKVNGF